MATKQIPKKWDGEADVIIVGGGNSGLPAAIIARDKGAKVIVLEASGGMSSSLALIAGGTPFAGTDIQKSQGIEDSADAMYAEALAVSGGSPELWRAICDSQLATYEWLKSIGAKPDLVLQAPGHKVRRSIRFVGHGVGLCKLLKDASEAKKLDIRFKRRAQSLIFDPAKGRVVGVRAKSDSKIENYKADKAVILTTGGFCRNIDLLKEYGPEYADLVPTAPPTHMGDGLKMALELGAATAGIGLAVCPSMPCDAESGRVLTGGWGGIMVNRSAQRWANEATPALGSYTQTYKDLLKQDSTGLHFQIFDEGIKKAVPGRAPGHEKVYSASTIEELAKMLELDPKALKATVDEYNSDIQKYGVDKKFGRNQQGMAEPGKSPRLINNPPYYGIKCKICLTSMKGGLKINGKTQVLNHFGEVIPGLYAAGEIAGGLMGIPSHYYTGTMTLQAFVQGYIAANNTVAERAK
jgi:fumarate reductase flavoprotein subunit